MPSTITIQLIGIWFCVGFFTLCGWALAIGLINRLLARF